MTVSPTATAAGAVEREHSLHLGLGLLVERLGNHHRVPSTTQDTTGPLLLMNLK